MSILDDNRASDATAIRQTRRLLRKFAKELISVKGHLQTAREQLQTARDEIISLKARVKALEDAS